MKSDDRNDYGTPVNYGAAAVFNHFGGMHNIGDNIHYDGKHHITNNYNLGAINITGGNTAHLNINAGNSITLTGIPIGNLNLVNTSSSLGTIIMNGNNPSLTIAKSITLVPITDTNSTGTISINPNLNITIGTSENPIKSLIIGDNSTVTLTDHLYTKDLVLSEFASIKPPEFVHLMGNNTDIDS